MQILRYKQTLYQNMKPELVQTFKENQPHQLVSLGNHEESREEPEENLLLKNRRVNKLPFKVLDAPMLEDDFYLNLLDWSQGNVLAVGLERSVYIWSAQTCQVRKICEVERDDQITSVGFSTTGSNLAVGTAKGAAKIFDTDKMQHIRDFRNHHSRVSSVAWNGQIISTGSRDKTIVNNDLRAPDKINRLIGHKQEVCGLRWSFDNS